MIHFKWTPFSELSALQLYEILALRSEVFVVEQKCPYLDPDGKDPAAIHLLGTENERLVSYLRLFPPTDTQQNIIFGRVLTATSARKKGYGRKQLEEMLYYCKTHYSGKLIQCSAQLYLKKFYEEYGFQSVGDVYDEDWIPHIAMECVI